MINYDPANKKKAKTKKQLKIEDFRHAGIENKHLSRQDQPFSHQYALGSNHRN